MSAGSYKQALGCFRVQGSGPQGSTCSLVEKASVLLSSQRMCKQLFSRNLLAQSTIHVPIDALFLLGKGAAFADWYDVQKWFSHLQHITPSGQCKRIARNLNWGLGFSCILLIRKVFG